MELPIAGLGQGRVDSGVGGGSNPDLPHSGPRHAHKTNVAAVGEAGVELVRQRLPHVVEQQVAEGVDHGEGAVEHPAVLEKHPHSGADVAGGVDGGHGSTKHAGLNPRRNRTRSQRRACGHRQRDVNHHIRKISHTVAPVTIKVGEGPSTQTLNINCSSASRASSLNRSAPGDETAEARIDRPLNRSTFSGA
ncbi:hypothetical protein DIRU0_E14884 [Diutina rugosa]